MWKFALLSVICLLFCSCSVRQEKTSETESMTVSETAGETTSESSAKTAETTTTPAAATEKTEPPESDAAKLGVNEDGTVSEEFAKRIEELMELDHEEKGMVYPSLYDFDDDGIPEIILIIHSGGQGYMPCKVYSAADLSYLGQFEGFCRDGFTRFEQECDGTLIYNYYEHSIHERRKDVTFARLTDGKLETTWLWGESGTISAGEYRPTVSITENKDEEALEWLAEQVEQYYGYIFYTSSDMEATLRGFRGGDSVAGIAAEYDQCVSAAVESYNNYIRFSKLEPHDEDDVFYRLVLVGDRNQMAFRQDKQSGGLYFIGEDGEKTLLSTAGYQHIYKLWDNIVVCQPSGTVLSCDVYTVKDGKAELIEELSGHGMFLDYSRLYNGGFALQHSVYDGMTLGGGHTYKKYQFYFDEDGVHEYGSIVIPLEEFYAAHGGEIREFEERMAEEGYEIYEVLYRADDCYILNLRQPIIVENEEGQEVFAGAYYQRYAAIKPMLDGTLSDVETEMESGRYLTALCPDIAVYPEKVYGGE